MPSLPHPEIPEFAFYQEGFRWDDEVAVKNALLFFDGLAFLVPEGEDDVFEEGFEWLYPTLEANDQLRRLRPTLVIGSDAANRICEYAIEQVVSYPETTDSDPLDYKLALSKLGVEHHHDLVHWVLQQMRERGLARLAEDRRSAFLPTVLGQILLHTVNVAICKEYSHDGIRLRPLYGHADFTLHALSRTTLPRDPYLFCPLLNDAATLRIDVGGAPLKEIVAFRAEFRNELETYKAHAAAIALFSTLLYERLGEDEFARAVSTRLHALKSAATEIEAAARGAWRDGGHVILDTAGLVLSATVGDVPQVVLGVLRSAVSASITDTAASSTAFSYLLRAQSTFGGHTDSNTEDCA